MDKPQYQVPKHSESSYRYMAYPIPKQQLQLLYPGRLMSNQFHYNGDNIPNEDPVGLEETREHTKALSRAAEMELEALERHLGGAPKLARHPAVEPEATIEDPDLDSLTIDLHGNSPNLEKVPSKLDDLPLITEDDMKIAERVRREIAAETTGVEVEPSPYGWRTPITERFQHGHPHKASKPSASPASHKSRGRSSRNYGLWIIIFIIVVLILASVTTVLCI